MRVLVSSGRPSYAAYMSAKSVSPPVGGTATACNTAAIDGTGAPTDVAVPAVLVAADIGRLGEPHQLGVHAVAGDERVHLELTEATGERDVLRRGHRLVAEEQHLVVEQRPAELGDHAVRQRGGEIDAGDVGADGGGDGPGLEGAPESAASRSRSTAG